MPIKKFDINQEIMYLLTERRMEGELPEFRGTNANE
jgi:hypothetical protein